jgi:hypothetical protein
MSLGHNLRRHRRIPYLGPIRISWEEHGQPRFTLAKCVDISETGLRIESPHPVRAGTTIQLAAERIQLSGAATVKHTIRIGSKYLLGIQLTRAMIGDKITQLEGRPVVTVLIENFNRIHQKV